jgi:hypothetical protein
LAKNPIIQEILRQGQRLPAKVRRRYILAALETGRIESNFTNPAGGDADSQGWRQERASLYRDPRNLKDSVARFYQEAAQLDRGQPSYRLAADVQRPAAQYRGRYRTAQGEAQSILGGSGGVRTTAPRMGITPTAPQPSQADIPQASPVNAGLDQDARKAAVMNFVMQGGIRNTSAVQALASTITSLNQQAQKNVVAAPKPPARNATTPPPTAVHGSGRSSPVRGVGGQLYELFWQGHNGINVKNGQPEPQGFVSGHTDHVHVAAGPRSVIRLGKLAESMGLHVGENPHFGGVTPDVHVKTSWHYKGQAIDVSGDPAVMAKYAHRVAKLYRAK